MIPIDAQPRGPIGDDEDGETAHLFRGLNTLYTTRRLEPGVRDRIRQAVLERATVSRAVPVLHGWRSARLRFSTLAAVLALGVGGSLAYRDVQGPTPVSAMTVLRRAAAAHLAPDQVAHRTYSLWQTAASTNPYDSTVDVWLQADANGATTHFAETQTQAARAAGSLTDGINRVVINGQTVQAYAYQPRANTVSLFGGTLDSFFHGQPNFFDSASLARYLTTVARGSEHGVRLLAPQALDGAPVLVIQVDGYPNDPQERNTIVYVDAQSYVLRGADFDFGKAGRIRLRSDMTIAVAALPPGTFAFTTPAGAQVLSSTGQPTDASGPGADPAASDEALKGYLSGVTGLQVFAKACSTTPDGLRVAFGRGGKTMLAICQATNHSVTLPGLVTALATPYKVKLEATVVTGAVTSVQASERLSALQARLRALLVMPI